MNARKLVVLAVATAMLMVLTAVLAGCSSGGSAAPSEAVSGSSAASASEAASGSDASSEASASVSSAASESNSAAGAEGDYELVTPGKLTVAISPYFPPFESMVDDEFVGIDVEVAKALAKKLGLEAEFKDIQFDAIIPTIVAGNMADVGISAFTVSPERANDVDFSDSYFVDGQAIAVMKGSGVTEANADKALNEKGMIIAVQSGTTGASYVKENYPEAKVQSYSNFIAAFADMQAGQIDAVCTNKAVVEKMLADSYPNAVIVKSIATGEEYAIAISKDNPGLTEAINAALDELGADGAIDKIVDDNLS